MITKSETVFEKTLSGLSQGFHVAHIATFDLESCCPDDDVNAALSRYPDFDQVPVLSNGCVIGVLERKDRLDGKVAECMRPLNSGIIIESEAPLQEFIPLMQQPPYYRLVLRKSAIDGIVTRSDLLKLPVRLLAFARISHLEMVMSELISLRCMEDEAWLGLLDKRQKNNIIDYWRRSKEEKSDPPLLEFAGFADKSKVVRLIYGLDYKFEQDMEELRKLRNKIAHSGNFAEDDFQLKVFIQRLQITDRWINCLTNILMEELE